MKTLPANFIIKDELDTREPVEVYHLWITPTGSPAVHWRYTSGDSLISYVSEDYIPATVQRSSIKYDENLGTMSVHLTIGYVNDPVLEFVAANPIDVVWVQIFKLFRDQDPYEASPLFFGTIKEVNFKGNAASINCTGFEHFLNSIIPRFRFSPTCNVFLFESLCGINKDNYKISATLTNVSIDKLVLTATEFSSRPNGWWTFGFVKIGENKRMIVKHVGSVIYLRNPILVAIGASVEIYAGCDGSVETCHARFNNINNFRGQPMIPISNPVFWSGSI